MKRIITAVLALICVLGLVGCGRSMHDVIGKEPNFTGIVAEVFESHIVVTVNDDEELYSDTPIVQVPLNVEIEDSYLDCSVGDEVTIYYDGNITVGEPTLIDKVYTITLRTPAGRLSTE